LADLRRYGVTAIGASVVAPTLIVWSLAAREETDSAA
jgi:hypothetical protein